MELRLCFSYNSSKNDGQRLVFKTSKVSSTKNIVILEAPAEFPEIPITTQYLEYIPIIIDKIICTPGSEYFLRPVDPIIDQAFNYFDIITQAIDLDTIRRNCLSKKYIEFNKFLDDFKLMVKNAMVFNAQTHVVHQAALQLSFVFADLLNTMLKNPEDMRKDWNKSEAESRIANAIDDLTRKRRERQRQADKSMHESVRNKNQPQKPTKRASQQDLDMLITAISNLSSSALIGVYEILAKTEFEHDKKSFDVDLSQLDDTVIESLKMYIESVKGVTDNKFLYTTRPHLPKELREITHTYANEMQSWLSSVYYDIG